MLDEGRTIPTLITARDLFMSYFCHCLSFSLDLRLDELSHHPQSAKILVNASRVAQIGVHNTRH